MFLSFRGSVIAEILFIYGKMSPIANNAKAHTGKILIEVKKILGDPVVISSWRI